MCASGVQKGTFRGDSRAGMLCGCKLNCRMDPSLHKSAISSHNWEREALVIRRRANDEAKSKNGVIREIVRAFPKMEYIEFGTELDHVFLADVVSNKTLFTRVEVQTLMPQILVDVLLSEDTEDLSFVVEYLDVERGLPAERRAQLLAMATALEIPSDIGWDEEAYLGKVDQYAEVTRVQIMAFLDWLMFVSAWSATPPWVTESAGLGSAIRYWNERIAGIVGLGRADSWGCQQ